jgi:hypothetical protein
MSYSDDLKQFMDDLKSKNIGVTKNIHTGYGNEEVFFFAIYRKGKNTKIKNVYDHRYLAVVHNPPMRIDECGVEEYSLEKFMRNEPRGSWMDIIMALDSTYHVFSDEDIQQVLSMDKINPVSNQADTRYKYYLDSTIPNDSTLFDFQWNYWA